MNGNKLRQLHQLIQERLQTDHIEVLFSAWNNPVFYTSQKFVKWRLSHDLCVANACLYSSVSPPLEFTQNYHVIVTDLKYCFFFLLFMLMIWKFSVPTVISKHLSHSHWKVLCQPPVGGIEFTYHEFTLLSKTGLILTYFIIWMISYYAKSGMAAEGTMWHGSCPWSRAN